MSGKTDVILQTYGVDASNVSARVEDLDGNPVRRGRAEGRQDGIDGHRRRGQATLKTKGLDPGVYELVLSAPGAGDSRIRVEVQ